MPSINFDENYEETFEEIKDLQTNYYRKLFDNNEIYKEILPILFPKKLTLKLLKKYFSEIGKTKTIYKNIANKIDVQ